MSAPKRRKITSDSPLVMPKNKKDQLYDRCLAAKPVRSDFTIQELEEFNVTSRDEELRDVCQDLIDCHLFSLWNQRGNTIYRTRTKEEALKLAKLNAESLVIYTQIEASAENGIWKRTIAVKTNLHENTVTKTIKDLISKSLVKEIKSAKATNKRIYILNHLDPSEENTGGNFYTDGELDTGLIDTLSDWVVGFVEGNSWVEQKGPPVQTLKDLKRKRAQERSSAQVIGEVTAGDRPIFKTPKGANGRPLVPYPPDHCSYPTPKDILKAIDDGQILKDVSLNEEDITQLAQHLVYDGRLEEMPMGGYRSIRRVWSRERKDDSFGPLDPDIDGIGPGNGLSQAPCGRCPVFEDCRIGGMVGPESCAYLKEWLQF